MKISTWAVLLSCSLALLPTEARVYIDYDRTATFKDYRSFAWLATDETSMKTSSPLMHARIKNAIEFHLTAGGLVEDTENPDIYVTYHGEKDKEFYVDVDHYGYGYGSGWGYSPYWRGGYGTSTATVTSYDVGTLIIDILDARKKTVIWRGTADGTIPSNPEKVAKKIDGTIEKLVKRWKKMKEQEGVE